MGVMLLEAVPLGSAQGMHGTRRSTGDSLLHACMRCGLWSVCVSLRSVQQQQQSTGARWIAVGVESVLLRPSSGGCAHALPF